MAKGSKREPFSRIPDSVNQDPRLCSRDKVVYGGMSRLERKGSVNAGYRKISGCCRVPYQKIGDSVARLIECGHVERRGESYFLTSTTFEHQPAKRSQGKRMRPNVVQAARLWADRGSVDEILEGLA